MAARFPLFAMEDDMGLLDGILGGVIGAEALSLVKDYIEKHGGIQGVVAEFEKTGFGQQAKSWISTGPNLPINAEQIQQALGSEKVKALAAKFGIPVDKVADLLAKHLPTAIDKATPEGKLPT
ncbi:MAG: YidB family protein [Methylocella sp.]